LIRLSVLKVGQQITIPNKISNLHNDYRTFKVYDPGKIIGDTTPTLPDPPPPPQPAGKKGCGGIGMILVVIVAIVATIFTAGAAAFALGAVASGTAATVGTVFSAGLSALAGGAVVGRVAATAAGAAGFIGAAAIGGGVGSIVSQGVGIALGVQDKFSWSAVAAGAVGAGVTAGFAGGGGIAQAMGIPANSTAAFAVNAAAANVTTQGLLVATGAQEKFNWKSVAISAISAPIAKSLAEGMPGTDFSRAVGVEGSRLATGLSTGVSTQLVRLAVYGGGRIDYASIAADAFGNAIGNSLASGSSSVNASQQREYLGDFHGDYASNEPIRLAGNSYSDTMMDAPVVYDAPGGGDRLSIDLGSSAAAEDDAIARQRWISDRAEGILNDNPHYDRDMVYRIAAEAYDSKYPSVQVFPIEPPPVIEARPLYEPSGEIQATPEPSVSGLWRGFKGSLDYIWNVTPGTPRGFKLGRSYDALTAFMGGMVNLGESSLADKAVESGSSLLQYGAIGVIGVTELVAPTAPHEAIPAGKLGRVFKAEERLGEWAAREGRADDVGQYLRYKDELRAQDPDYRRFSEREVKFEGYDARGEKYVGRGREVVNPADGSRDVVPYRPDGSPDVTAFALARAELDRFTTYDRDFAAANRQNYFGSGRYSHTSVYPDTVWHHDTDCRTLLLIPAWLHEAVKPHRGGMSSPLCR
jgi:hypothetical protein